MGNLVWHEYSRLLSITAASYTIWAGLWGLIYRKFFWDFVGGTLRDPGGLQSSRNVKGFVKIVVKAPIIQVLAIVLGLSVLALEFPLPKIDKTRIYRSFVVRVVLLLSQASVASVFYQGTNGALWSVIAAVGYTAALIRGELMAEVKNNRGGGQA